MHCCGPSRSHRQFNIQAANRGDFNWTALFYVGFVSNLVLLKLYEFLDFSQNMSCCDCFASVCECSLNNPSVVLCL